MKSRDFSRLVIQLIAQNVVTALIGAADAIMSGALEPNALSSVVLAGQYVQLYTFFLTALCIGSTVLASQYYGGDDLTSVKKVMNYTIRVSSVGGLLFFAMAFGAPSVIMRFLTSEEALIANGAAYLRVSAPIYLFLAFSQIYMNIMKNTGSAKGSMSIGIVTAVLNIVLNYVFIFGAFGVPSLGVVGAAVATTIARAAELAATIFFSRRSRDFRFDLKEFFRSGKGISGKFWRYTLPSLLQVTSWKLAFTCAVAVVGHLGSDIVAASSYAIIVYSVLTAAVDGYAGACGITVGRYLGQGELETARKEGDAMLKGSLVFGCGLFLLSILICPVLLRFSGGMAPGALRYLKFMILFAGFRCIGNAFNNTLASGLFSAGGDIMYLLRLDIVNMWLVTLPLGLLAAYLLHFPPLAVYVLLNLDEFYKIVLMYKRYKKYCWLKNLTRKEWAPLRRYEDTIRKQIIGSLPAGVLVITGNGRVSMANSAAAKLLGRELDDIEGCSYIELFLNDPENSEFADLVLEAVNDKENTHEGQVSYRRNGESVTLNVRSSFMEDEDCKLGICLLLTD